MGRAMVWVVACAALLATAAPPTFAAPHPLADLATAAGDAALAALRDDAGGAGAVLALNAVHAASLTVGAVMVVGVEVGRAWERRPTPHSFPLSVFGRPRRGAHPGDRRPPL